MVLENHWYPFGIFEPFQFDKNIQNSITSHSYINLLCLNIEWGYNLGSSHFVYKSFIRLKHCDVKDTENFNKFSTVQVQLLLIIKITSQF